MSGSSRPDQESAEQPVVVSSDQLDAILIELRSRRERAGKAGGRSAPGAAMAPVRPVPASSAAAATAAPSAADAPEGLAHLPKSVGERLKSFVAGDDAAPPQLAEPPPVVAPGAPTVVAAAPAAVRQLSGPSELRAAIEASRSAFVSAGVFSFVLNILMLAGPLFMLQVYDRVMTSGSMPTLVALSLITAAIYGIIGVLELVRSRIVVRIGVEVDRRIGDRIFQAGLRRSLVAQGTSASALRELDSLRQFIGGPGPLTFFDAPWTPVYLLVIFLTHWVLGVASLLGALLLLALAWASEARSRSPLVEAGKAAGRSIELAETGQRNAESITAMGMLAAYRARWQAANRDALSWQLLASDRLGSMSALSKSVRLLLQSFLLALGAGLAIKGEISAGAIIAATIIFGRALAPVEQAIAHWRGFVKAREAYEKLDMLLRQSPEPAARTALPTPKGRLEVAGLRVASPDQRAMILANLAFTVEPGQVLAVIGPSASGKSTLVRTLAGLWQPIGGTVKLDGSRLDQWGSEALGRHLGYLPQDVELFAGSVRDNIARFRADASDADIIAAARMAHAHDMIIALPQGYDTQLGAFGTYLSAGQRQRIGLARALFASPPLVILDEPNANLDRIGDEALGQAIDGMRERGQTVVVVSHRVQAIGKADLVLYLDRGVQRAFGPRAEVLRAIQASADQAAGRGPAAPAPQRGPQPAQAAPRRAAAGAASSPQPETPPQDISA